MLPKCRVRSNSTSTADIRQNMENDTPLEVKIERCMDIVTQHIIKTVQGDTADDKHTIATLLHANEQLQIELDFYKRQFSSEDLYYLDGKFCETQKLDNDYLV